MGAPRITDGQRLKLVRRAVYSYTGKTLTAEQALAIIGALFTEPPEGLINPDRLPQLLAAIAAAQKPRRRGEVDRSVDVGPLQEMLAGMKFAHGVASWKKP